MNQEYYITFLEEPVMVIVYDNILRLYCPCKKSCNIKVDWLLAVVAIIC